MSKVTDTLHDTTDRVTEKVSEAYASARDAAGGAGRRAASGIEANPLAALAGGLAIGAAAAALLPASKREAELLGPVGARISDAAKGAVDAARTAGGETLGELGISQQGVKEQIDKLVDAALKTINAAGGAAVQSLMGQASKS